MSSAASVLVCVLTMLGWPASRMPPIVLLEVRPPDVSASAEAFVLRDPDTIYLITSTPVFRDAQRGDHTALRKVASIVAHEEWHVRHGADERGAYLAQLTTLTRLGAGPGTGLYYGVMLSMRAALKARRPPKDMLASRADHGAR